MNSRIRGACGALILLSLNPPAPAAAQRTSETVTAVRLDARRGAELAKRSEGMLSVSDLLRQTGTVELKGDQGMSVVVHIFRMRGGEVLESFRSRPIDVSANGTVPLGKVLQPGQPQYGNLVFEPSFVVEAGKAVPAGDAIDDPGRFVINGVIPYKPKHWESMEAIYAVAVPADRSLLGSATAMVGGTFVRTPTWSD